MTTKTHNPADKVERWDITKLVPYARNARTHSDEQVGQIAASIKEWGWTTPVLVDENGSIIAGHGRTLAAQRLQMTEVPVMVAKGWSDAKKRAYVLADNKLAMNAGWDNEMLALELGEIGELGFDLDLTGFTADEIAALMPEQIEPGLTDPDDAPSVQENATTVSGDVWIMGKHRLMCGDSTSADSVNTLTLGGGIDMLLTDPPYNVAVVGGAHDPRDKKNYGKGPRIENDSMGDAQFREFLKSAFIAATAAMKPGAVFYIWHADSEGYNFRGACKDAGLQIRQCLIWKKQQMVMGRQDYHWKHEPCLYGWKDGAGHLWATDRKQTTILEFDRPMRSDKLHPTVKPVALFEYQLLNNTKGGDLCLDLFGGSGTTLIACEKNGRYARVMELDPKYCDVIIRRWQSFTGKRAVLESTGQPFPESPVTEDMTEA